MARLRQKRLFLQPNTNLKHIKMKKNLLFVALLLGLTLGATAQSKHYKAFGFGFKVGPGFDWIGSTTGGAQNEGTRVGMNFGLIADFYFAENYAISSGININLNRGHYSFENARLDSLSGLQKYNVDRLYKGTVFEIPLMLKMVTNQFGDFPMRYFAQVGAGVGYAQKVRVADEYEDIVRPDEYTATNKEFSNLRFALKAGIGAQYSIDETMRIFLSLNFSHDFVNNINSISPNYYRYYYDGNNKIEDVERSPRLNLLQNRFSIEVGFLF